APRTDPPRVDAHARARAQRSPRGRQRHAARRRARRDPHILARPAPGRHLQAGARGRRRVVGVRAAARRAVRHQGPDHDPVRLAVSRHRRTRTRPRRRLLSRVGSLLLTLLSALGLVCIALVVLGLVMNVSLVMFSTGSMAPTIPAGSVALVREVPASEIEVGDVVTVDRDGRLPVTHRVTEILAVDGSSVTFTMQGDANEQEDAEPYTAERVRLVLGSVPGVARAVASLQSRVVLGLLTLGVAPLGTGACGPRAAAEGGPRAGSAGRSGRPALLRQTAVGPAHVAGLRDVGGEAVPQQHRTRRRGRRRLQQLQVGGHGPAVEDLLARAEREREDPEVEAVVEALTQQGLDERKTADDVQARVLLAQAAQVGRQVPAQLAAAGPAQVRAPRDATYFGMLLNRVAMPPSTPSSWWGQCAAKISYVRRPSTRASMPSMPATTSSSMVASNSGACQPPNAKPSGSSSGSPGLCPTMSSVANRSMWMSPMVLCSVPRVPRAAAGESAHDAVHVAAGVAITGAGRRSGPAGAAYSWRDQRSLRRWCHQHKDPACPFRPRNGCWRPPAGC